MGPCHGPEDPRLDLRFGYGTTGVTFYFSMSTQATELVYRIPPNAEDPHLIAAEPGYYFWKDQDPIDLSYWIKLSDIFKTSKGSWKEDLKEALKQANETGKPVERHRNYFLTFNNWTSDDFVNVLTWKYTSWCFFGFEVGELCGTPHMHVALGCKSQIMEGTIKQMFPGREVQATKNIHLVIAYCIKDGHCFIRGTLPQAPAIKAKKGGDATKRKWERIAELARCGNLDDIASEEPHAYITSYQNLKKIKADCRPIPEDLPMIREDATETVTRGCGIWIWGPSQCGKSHRVRTEYGKRICNKPCNNKWMPNSYDPDQHDVILLEDFDIRHKAFVDTLKIWADRYAFTVELKGTMLTVRPEKIIITSNYHPRDIWFEEQDIQPILSRFRVIHHKVYYGPFVNSIMNFPKPGDEQEHGFHPDDPFFKQHEEIPAPVTPQYDTTAQNEDDIWMPTDWTTINTNLFPPSPIAQKPISKVGFFTMPEKKNTCNKCNEELTPIGYDQEIHFCDPMKMNFDYLN